MLQFHHGHLRYMHSLSHLDWLDSFQTMATSAWDALIPKNVHHHPTGGT
jgi:hypothetical protein